MALAACASGTDEGSTAPQGDSVDESKAALERFRIESACTNQILATSIRANPPSGARRFVEGTFETQEFGDLDFSMAGQRSLKWVDGHFESSKPRIVKPPPAIDVVAGQADAVVRVKMYQRASQFAVGEEFDTLRRRLIEQLAWLKICGHSAVGEIETFEVGFLLLPSATEWLPAVSEPYTVYSSVRELVVEQDKLVKPDIPTQLVAILALMRALEERCGQVVRTVQGVSAGRPFLNFVGKGPALLKLGVLRWAGPEAVDGVVSEAP